METSHTASTKPATIDEYLAPLDNDKRAALEHLRRTIHAAAPGAEECISYNIPGFRLDGKVFIWIGATAKHCAIYGVDGSLADQLTDYDTSGRGTVRFKPNEIPPDALLQKIIHTQIAKNATR